LKRGVKGTNTVRFIRKANIPPGRKVTYGSFVVDIKPHKEETESTLVAVGGDQIEYPGDISTHTAGLTTTKCFSTVQFTRLGLWKKWDIHSHQHDFNLTTPLS
jgi:hypothetical protein